MKIVHLAASPFFGGPERQMLGLGESLRPGCRSVYVSFPERGLCRPFLEQARRRGFEAIELERNAPHFRASSQELAHLLRRVTPDILCCHGYKPDLLGWLAARRIGLPVVSVSRGWTGATLKVKANEALDRWVLRFMDAVVCVSDGQAAKVRRAGVAAARTWVIRNAIDLGRFTKPDPDARRAVEALFPRPPRRLVAGAGRLSPEKGFLPFVEAAARVVKECPDTGFVIYGDGPERPRLAARIVELGLEEQVILAGFCGELDSRLPAFDLFVLSSFTEGLPNVVLEAFAARVPVVATAVGGTPEVVEDGVSGYLVPPGDPARLAGRIIDVLRDEPLRKEMGARGRERVERDFSFAAQAQEYVRLFNHVLRRRAQRTSEQMKPCTL
jgi:glycosyltransferase involved in cell wall biosynthesis